MQKGIDYWKRFLIHTCQDVHCSYGVCALTSDLPCVIYGRRLGYLWRYLCVMIVVLCKPQSKPCLWSNLWVSLGLYVSLISLIYVNMAVFFVNVTARLQFFLMRVLHFMWADKFLAPKIDLKKKWLRTTILKKK